MKDPAKVFVLCQNDFPIDAYVDRDAAYQARDTARECGAAAYIPGRRLVHYNVYEVPLISSLKVPQ